MDTAPLLKVVESNASKVRKLPDSVADTIFQKETSSSQERNFDHSASSFCNKDGHNLMYDQGHSSEKSKGQIVGQDKDFSGLGASRAERVVFNEPLGQLFFPAQLPVTPGLIAHIRQSPGRSDRDQVDLLPRHLPVQRAMQPLRVRPVRVRAPEPGDMRRLIEEGVALGTVGQIVFSGGEPTLRGEDLFEGIRSAASRSLPTRVVTNGCWGKSAEAALACVRRFREAGLTEINLSVVGLHQFCIRLGREVHAFRACPDQQLPCRVAHQPNRDAEITPERFSRKFGVERTPFDPRRTYTHEETCRLISTGSIIPITRDEAQADERQMLSPRWTGSCGSVLRNMLVGAKGHFAVIEQRVRVHRSFLEAVQQDPKLIQACSRPECWLRRGRAPTLRFLSAHHLPGG